MTNEKYFEVYIDGNRLNPNQFGTEEEAIKFMMDQSKGVKEFKITRVTREIVSKYSIERYIKWVPNE